MEEPEMEESEMKKGVKISAATEEDAKELLDIYAPYVRDTAITFEYEVPDVPEFKRRIRKVQKKYPYLAARIDGRIAGYAYVSPLKERKAYDWAVETSIYVDREQRGRGIGKALYEALEEALKKQGILNLYACIATPKEEDKYLTFDSVRFHEHMGYRLIGEFKECGYKFHRWYHVVWMEKQIGEHRILQPEVKSFKDI